MMPIENKVDISILVTSVIQREITIETVNYYAELSGEVIFVDEELPHLSKNEINSMKKKGIIYIPYISRGLKAAAYEKRKIAANHSTKNFVVHSNHDERYTFTGLKACVDELEKDNNLIFCAGQAIAIRGDKSNIHLTRSYKNLHKYSNINSVEARLYYHAENYAPIAHYSVWRKKPYINATIETLKIHDLMPSRTMLEEIIFELAADLSGNSKTVPVLYWIRNRINPPFGTWTPAGKEDKGDQVFVAFEKKLSLLLNTLDDEQMNIIMNGLKKNLPFVKSYGLISKSVLLTKRLFRTFIKKKKITFRDIDIFLHENKIKYDKNEISKVIDSMI
jgi:hypothetical protein